MHPSDDDHVVDVHDPHGPSPALPEQSRTRRRRTVSMHVSAQEQDRLNEKTAAELLSRGLESWAPDTEETRKEEEDIVSSHMIKARERAPSNRALLSRQPSPMVLGTALTSPLPHIPSRPASSTGSRPTSVASAPHHAGEAWHPAPHPSSDSDGTTSPQLSPFGSPMQSPIITRRTVTPSTPPAESAFFPLSGVVPPPAPSSHASEGKLSTELHASMRLSPRSSNDLSYHRGVSFEGEPHRAIRPDGTAAFSSAAASGSAPPGTCSSEADKPSWLPRSAHVKLAFLSAVSRNPSAAPRDSPPHAAVSRSSPVLPAGTRQSPIPPGEPKPVTYEHVQLETAMSRAVAVAQHRISFFDRLERVRRGQSTAHRPSNGRSSSSAAGERRVHRQARSAPSYSHREEATSPVAEETSKQKKSLTFSLPDDEDKQPPESEPPDAPAGREPIKRSSTMHAQRKMAQAEAKMGEFERESSRYESFQFEDEESTLHLEFRAGATESDRLTLLVVSVLLILAIGVLLGCISATITLTEARIWAFKARLVDRVMWPCESIERECTPDEKPYVGAAFLTYLSLNLLLILGAAVLTHFAPRAALSGLPPLKAYLNGTRVPGLLHPRTMVAKVIGITLVVATGLPMGREGPMVHTGACVAAVLSRLRIGPMPKLLLGIPSRQRVWVGMGAAAGVAAAFNAPLGGVLYSFEEVCSHWSNRLTWRSFLCVTIAAYIFNLLIRLYTDSTDGADQGDEGDVALATDTLLTDSFVIGLNFEESHTYGYEDFGWLAIVGILGGLLGAAYTTIVVHAVRLRRHFLGNRPRGRVVDALWWSTLAFSIYYWAPFLFPCKPCPDGTDCGHAYTTNYIGNVTNSRRLSEAPTRPLWVFGGPSVPAGRRLAGGGGGLVFVQHACPAYHYNEMATLLLSPQEGLIKHLLQRESFNDEYLSIGTEAAMLGIYFVVAVIVFGISVPAGNFIPALTLGAAMGRFLGDVLPGTSEGDAGRLALMGAGAVLCGVTRMTITLVAILIEVTHDVGALLPLMYTLAIAKVSADLFAPSFDDGMMRVMRLPYLEEEPPHEFELLTARDVMPDKVVVLREVERVGDVFAVLKRTRHSGFPVVDVGQCNDCTFFSGIIVRRHLLVLLKMRVWEYHAAGLPEPAHVRLAFVSSSRSDVVDDREDLASLSFTDEEKQAVIDLRPYMDPSPYLANELMPLRRVYRLFGEIGVRHVPVVDCREQVVGIITRRDVQPEIIEERVIARERERTRAAVAEARRAFYDSDEAAAAAADFGGGPPPPPARGSMAAAGARTSKAARGLLAKAGVLKPVIETNDDEAPSPSGSPLRGPVDIRFTERKSTTDLMQLMAAESLEARGIETLPPKAIKARKALSTSLERLPQIAPRKGLSSSCDSLPQLGRISPESKRGPPFIRQSAAGPARRRNVADVVTASKADEEQYSVLHVTRRPAATQQAIPTLVSPISRYASLSRHTHTHGDAAQHQHDHGHDSGIRAAHARPGGRAAPGDPAQNDTVLHEHYHGADAEGGPPSDRTSGSR